MTQEDKELLLQDLCGRLPYGVVIQEKCLEHDETFLPYAEDNKLVNIDVHEELVITSRGSLYYIEEFKPYLFPLSSMTEEQKKELDKKFNVIDIYGNNILIHYHSQGHWDTDLEVDFQDWLWLINWLNKNHFDYKGLIEKGLAIDATGLNIY